MTFNKWVLLRITFGLIDHGFMLLQSQRVFNFKGTWAWFELLEVHPKYANELSVESRLSWKKVSIEVAKTSRFVAGKVATNGDAESF